MDQSLMHLKILLPYGIFTDRPAVRRIVAETGQGSFGLLPHRLDCVAALTPGIFTYETDAEGEIYVAVDEGVLVKAGPNVYVSVRHATAGHDLAGLRAAVERDYRQLTDQQKSLHSSLAKLESNFIRRFQQFRQT
jgi:F-type H+-transporting ATPase subunit epsilon